MISLGDHVYAAKNETILIADDKPENLRLLTRILNGNGYLSHAAINGRLALELIRNTQPDLVLLDIRMPEMDGYEVCRRLKEDRKLADIPVIFISGLRDTEDKVKAFEAGGVDFITKPFQVQEVLARVETHLALRRMRLRLEELVQERTSELQVKTEQLQIEIAERKKIEQTLRRSEELHQEAEEIAHIGHWELKHGANCFAYSQEGHKIFEINDEANCLSFEAFLGRIHPEDRDLVAEAFSRSIHGNTQHDIIYRLLFPENRVKYVHEKCKTGYDADDRPVCSVGTVQDITPLKRAEAEREAAKQQLAQSQKMEAIGTLAGGIAHDFNNMLQAIIGYSTLLTHALPKESEEYAYAESIKTSGRTAADLIRQILAFSRKNEYLPQPLQVQLILKEVLKLLKGSLPSTIFIKEKINQRAGFIWADATQLHQIIMNLATNAFHAMLATGGTLTVELNEINIDRKMKDRIPGLNIGKHIELVVRDTGYGMDAATMERMYEPYFTTKEKGEGTGLGLSTVHGLVKQYHGSIVAESEPGKGTTFSIYFPVVEADAVSRKKKEDEKALPHLHGRVLFVDDFGFNVQLGKRVLEKIGCEVVGMTNSLDALEVFKAASDTFDIVITDQTMPNLTGFDLARQMLTIRPEIPIFMLTGHSDTVDESKATSIGIRKYLMKPLEIFTMAEAISEVLHGKN